jgi:hypothetical protein
MILGMPVRFSTLCTNCLRTQSDCNCKITATLLRMNFIHDEVMIPVPTRLNDDLPPHVKGNIYWHLTQGCYYLPYEGNHTPMEFINDEWFVLTINKAIFQSCPER